MFGGRAGNIKTSASADNLALDRMDREASVSHEVDEGSHRLRGHPDRTLRRFDAGSVEHAAIGVLPDGGAVRPERSVDVLDFATDVDKTQPSFASDGGRDIHGGPHADKRQTLVVLVDDGGLRWSADRPR